MKAGVQAVAVAGSGGTEGMATRAIALAEQMDILEQAVQANNPNVANPALSSISAFVVVILIHLNLLSNCT